MSTPDLWADAETIAQRLRRPEAELLVAIGAEAWCHKCQRLRPAFEQLGLAAPEHVLPLWLDLEEHADFLGDFVPPDLPLLLRWYAGQCVQAALLQDIDLAAADPLQRVRMLPLTLQGECVVDPTDGALLALPPLWASLAGRT